MLLSQVYKRDIFSYKERDFMQCYFYGGAFQNLALKNCPLSAKTCSTAEL